MAGVAAAIVTNNSDPERKGRVRLHFPWLPEENESGWARVAVPYAGPGRGFHFIPEVDDEVLVAFEEGDPGRPFVIGSLWSGCDDLPGPPAEKNARKVLRTRSGFEMAWDEEQGSERFTLRDPEGKRSIAIDLAGNSIRIAAEDGDVEIAAPQGMVRIACKDLSVECSGRMSLAVDSDLSASAGGGGILSVDGDLSVEAAGTAACSGRSLDLRGAAAASLRGGKVAIRADALLTEEAPLVKIN
jgi:phage baseplate assembly protein gpV